MRVPILVGISLRSSERSGKVRAHRPGSNAVADKPCSEQDHVCPVRPAIHLTMER